MKITSVTYRRLKSGPGYEHEAVEATAEVGEETPLEALTELRGWVDAQLGERQRAQQLAWDASEAETRLRAARAELKSVQGLIAEAREVWNGAKAFCERHGLTLEVDEPIPF